MKNRRKRMSRPPAMIVFGTLLIALPFLNYGWFTLQYGIPPILVKPAFQAIMNHEPFFLVLFPLSVGAGAGLIAVQKWGWYAFLVYAILLIPHNAVVALQSSKSTNWSILVTSIIAFAAAFYFLKKDIRAPFLNMSPRGWRWQNRSPLQIPVIINGKEGLTLDFSPTGMYVELDDTLLEASDPVTVQLYLRGRLREIAGGIVRVDDNGVGVAFRDLDAEAKELIAEICREPGISWKSIFEDYWPRQITVDDTIDPNTADIPPSAQ